MLSRIAESIYWIGRLVERAEDTARLLDVHVSMLLEDVGLNEARMCADVLTALGLTPPESVTTTGELLEAVAYAPDGPIVGALTAARENARTVREAISSEMWEALNTTRNSLAAQRTRARKQGPYEFFAFVKIRAALVSGLAESTMARDDGWSFLTLGRSLERVDMTVRTLSVAGAHGILSWPQWRCFGLVVRSRPTCAPTARWSPRSKPLSSCCWTGCSRGPSSMRSPRPNRHCCDSCRPASAERALPTRRC